MRLASFIRADTSTIVCEWERFARTLIPAAEGMSPLGLRDHIHEILAFVAADIESLQTADEQIEKSHGGKRPNSGDAAAEAHASLRQSGGFSLSQMVSEFRALRASVLNLWIGTQPVPTEVDICDFIRFNEAVDQVLAVSANYYSECREAEQSLLFGILSHDLRNPLSAAQMSSSLALKIGPLSDRQTMLISQCIESTERASAVISSLLEATQARLGSGLPIVKKHMCLGFVARALVDEMRSLHPSRVFHLELTGDTEGEWDKARIGQIFSNLLGNAVDYGFSDSPVTIKVEGLAEEVALSVHNDGIPIPPGDVGNVFNSFSRAQPDKTSNGAKGLHLGLGLYIVKEIVTAHDGNIDVSSTEMDGTIFTARLPRLSSH